MGRIFFIESGQVNTIAMVAVTFLAVTMMFASLQVLSPYNSHPLTGMFIGMPDALNSNIIAYYSLDAGAGDLSGNGLNGWVFGNRCVKSCFNFLKAIGDKVSSNLIKFCPKDTKVGLNGAEFYILIWAKSRKRKAFLISSI